jgi:FixJ family two-component response regulator
MTSLVKAAGSARPTRPRELTEIAQKVVVSRMSEAAVIHIIDDDESMRAALDGLLRSVGLAPAAHASASEFLAAKRPDVPGCLVLDVRMPGISGLEFQEKLSGLGIRLPVILMTGHGDIPMSVRGMKAGAVDFLTKPFRDQDMIDAVAMAIRRDRVRRDAEAAIIGLREKFTTLSSREREVMHLVAAGKMNKQVASDLGVSEITVKLHRGVAMRKMGARTLADLVRMAQALQLDNGNDDLRLSF